MLLSRETVKNLIISAENLLYSRVIASPKDASYGKELQLPVIDQLASPAPGTFPEHYGKISDEAAAKRFGTQSLDDYSFWAWRACGIALISTIISSTGKTPDTLFAISKRLDKENGYIHSHKQGNDLGWKYSALATYLTERGIQTKISGLLSVNRLLTYLQQDKWVIASVKSRISAGTHLVLVTNYQQDKGSIFITYHDPFYDRSGGKQLVYLSEFQEIFNSRGIIVSPELKPTPRK
ncbi:MAG: C39 family peptidase [Candidatus Dojkabacteria bacterium]|nr:MAG: C39 family peptidase [Candidatus Dojkabacteria bacterium]